MLILSGSCGSYILERIQNSTFSFYLTGSRFFGGGGPNSDWDLYAAWSREIEIFLADIGFHEKVESAYLDPMTMTVMENGDVTVQLLHPRMLEAKHTIQSILSTLAFSCKPKCERAEIWHMMSSLASKLVPW
jgi:hypothetical protein